jgi:hypothetical protein
MAKDASLFLPWEENIFFAYDPTLNVTRIGRVDCDNGVNIYVYHAPHLSENMLYVT